MAFGRFTKKSNLSAKPRAYVLKVKREGVNTESGTFTGVDANGQEYIVSVADDAIKAMKAFVEKSGNSLNNGKYSSVLIDERFKKLIGREMYVVTEMSRILPTRTGETPKLECQKVIIGRKQASKNVQGILSLRNIKSPDGAIRLSTALVWDNTAIDLTDKASLNEKAKKFDINYQKSNTEPLPGMKNRRPNLGVQFRAVRKTNGVNNNASGNDNAIYEVVDLSAPFDYMFEQDADGQRIPGTGHIISGDDFLDSCNQYLEYFNENKHRWGDEVYAEVTTYKAYPVSNYIAPVSADGEPKRTPMYKLSNRKSALEINENGEGVSFVYGVNASTPGVVIVSDDKIEQNDDGEDVHIETSFASKVIINGFGLVSHVHSNITRENGAKVIVASQLDIEKDEFAQSEDGPSSNKQEPKKKAPAKKPVGEVNDSIIDEALEEDDEDDFVDDTDSDDIPF